MHSLTDNKSALGSLPSYGKAPTYGDNEIFNPDIIPAWIKEDRNDYSSPQFGNRQLVRKAKQARALLPNFCEYNPQYRDRAELAVLLWEEEANKAVAFEDGDHWTVIPPMEFDPVGRYATRTDAIRTAKRNGWEVAE